MAPLTLSRRTLMPSWTGSLLDTGSLFGSFLPEFDGDFPMRFGYNLPQVNIVENTKDYRIEMAAPGLTKKDFHIDVDNDVLTIRSEKKEETKEEKENYTCREFSYSRFSRSFRLPDNCLPEKIDAKYENGILMLSLPKKEVTVTKPAKEIKIG
jgi:HSP20 family protein